MRVLNLVAAAAASALLVGAVGVPANAATAPSPANAGSLVTWGDEGNPNAAQAIPVPEDLSGLVTSVAANANATGVVTLAGALRVWGATSAPEVNMAPSGITDAAVVVLTTSNGAVLHTDGHITAWGASTALSQVPSDLRAKALALQGGTGYAVRTDGTLATWGEAPLYPEPGYGLTNLVDVSVSPYHVLALHADGTVSTWGGALPGLLDVPDFGGKKVVKAAAGFLYSGVVFEDGTIDIWGFAPFIPVAEPAFDGLTPATKVVDLSLGASSSNAAAVTADGAVHAWGQEPTVTTVPASLTGQPVSAVAVGQSHAAAVVTTFRELTKPTLAGAPTVGQTLTATPATFSLTPDAPATGQWYAGNDPIAGKTATTLVLEAPMVGKSISYRTTATRNDVTITSASVGVGPVSQVGAVASSVAVSVAPASSAVGSTRRVTATVTSTGGPATGVVTFKVGTKTATAKLSGGKATWTLPFLAVGRHSVTAAYGGGGGIAASTSAAARVTVTKAGSTVSGMVKATSIPTSAKKVAFPLTVTSAGSVSRAGKVTVTLVGPSYRAHTVTVTAAGKAVVTFATVKPGKYVARIAYAGNSNVSGSSRWLTFRV